MDLQAVFVSHNGVLGGSCITAENNAILIHDTRDGGTCLDCFRSSKTFFDQSSVPVQNQSKLAGSISPKLKSPN